MNILKKSKGKISNTQGKYERFNLRDNPFPSSPTINKFNSDNRYNGKIYEDKIRENEFKKVEDNFLKVAQSNPNHLRLGYIMDQSYVGKGNGKSAFSLNLLEKINKNYCLDISDETNKCFGIYLSPEPSGRTKSFYGFVDLLFNSILESGIIKYCLASMRLSALLELNKNFDVEAEFDSEDDIIAKLNNGDWYRKKSIKISDLSKIMFENEHLGKFSQGFPLTKDKSNFEIPNPTEQRHFEKHYSDLKKAQRLNFIFTDLVNFFLASGFNGAYIIVDDFERIPDFQSDRQKREFAQELRANLFDNMTQNAKIGFYNFIFVLHAGVHRLIEKAWSDSGLERRSPLSAINHNSKHIIKFNKLTHEHTILLLKKYLSEYRINPADNDILPFSNDAVLLISEKSELNASGILEKAHQLIEKAAEENVPKINKQLVEELFGESQDTKPSINDIADEKSTDLFKKAAGE